MNEFDRTKNGYLILERSPDPHGGELIIAFLGSHESEINTLHPFVVWWKRDDGETFQGTYCANLVEAAQAFQERGGVFENQLARPVQYRIEVAE